MVAEHGHAARLRVARTYLGLDKDEMAAKLRVNRANQARWESGQYPIPAGIWDEIDHLYSEFDADVEALLENTEPDEAGRRWVRVWRGRTADNPFPGWRLRVASEAMRRDPTIEPVFPEDDPRPKE
ncbi:helix-turn-helix domain-containing protein [Nocardia cyriacigeorgica]|uniref:helix-turn-helix domain-containing protein n=1 Tax=Nocardia cyriacigeorgica TaxID=135487 RepID=UPI002457004F|nr:hypothetical protein [Nocardia cyriacigeorgica]